ncbi:MAG: NifX-associated nitrogen fixation protein [Rhodocyclaceae bacterium]|nr:NifX-associated nitrogen fixation protein [Rhodocyclaceae bacterium]
MTETADEDVMASDFICEMSKQMRAIDTYGHYDGWSSERLLEPFVLSREARKRIPLVGDPDEVTIARIKAYYNAIAALVEQRGGRMAGALLNISHEGFGRAMITVGRLIVVDRRLRDVHRFGFESLAKMQADAEKMLSSAVALVERHPDVAAL